jgi:hypothetical protein
MTDATVNLVFPFLRSLQDGLETLGGSSDVKDVNKVLAVLNAQLLREGGEGPSKPDADVVRYLLVSLADELVSKAAKIRGTPFYDEWLKAKLEWTFYCKNEKAWLFWDLIEKAI